MKPIFFIGSLVVAFLAGYLVHDNTTNSLTTAPVTTPTDTEEATTETAYEVVPSGYRFGEDGTIFIDAAIMAGTLTEVYVEYGTSPWSLDQQNIPFTDGLGMGTAGEYGRYSLPIDGDTLAVGGQYFYHIVARTNDGDTIRTGLNTFDAQK